VIARRLLLLAISFALPALCLFVPFSGAWQAFPRLAVAFFFVLIGPGYLMMEVFRQFGELRCHFMKYIFSLLLGYAFLTFVCALVILLHLDVNAGLAIVLGSEAVLGFHIATRSGVAGTDTDVQTAPSPWNDMTMVGPIIVTLAGALVAYVAWVIGSPILGEEIVDLAIIRKITELPSITLDNMGQQPGQILTYILAPYPFLIALLAKLSGLPIIAVYVKLRPFVFVSAVIACWCMAWVLLRRRSLAWFATMLLLFLLFIDPDPWTWPASFFPYGRRGSFAAGVLLPGIMCVVLHLCATEQKSKVPLIVLPGLLLIALVMTHGLEAFFALWFVGGLVLCAFLWPGTGISRTGSLLVAASAVTGAGLFRAVHAAVVPEIAAYEAMSGTPQLVDVLAQLRDPVAALLGGIPEGAKYLIATSGAVVVWAILPIALVPLLILRFPPVGRLLWCALVPPLVLMSVPIGAELLATVSTSDVFFAIAYFAPFGLVSATVLLADAAGTLDRRLGAYRVVWVQIVIGFALGALLLVMSYRLMSLITSTPLLLPVVAAVGGIAASVAQMRVCIPSGDRTDRVAWQSFPTLIAVAMPLFIGMKFFPGEISGSDRQNLIAQFLTRSSAPSAVEWSDYYPVLQRTTRPTIDIPLAVLEPLQRALRPGGVILYDPDHSYALPALMNVYTATSGQVLSSDMEYFRHYVRRDGDRLVHPLYNLTPGLSNEELCFLAATPVDYIIANPRYRQTVDEKLERLSQFIHVVFDADGYVAYSVAAGIRDAARAECRPADLAQ
jgi:hypothetical protein